MGQHMAWRLNPWCNHCMLTSPGRPHAWSLHMVKTAAACSSSTLEACFATCARGVPVAARQVARAAEVAAEAADLRLSFPRLASVEAVGATLRLGFLNLAAELSFSADLHLGAPLTHASCPAALTDTMATYP